LLAHLAVTLRVLARLPGAWLFALGAAGIGWLCSRIGILAIGNDPRRDVELAAGTAHFAGVAFAIWSLGSRLYEDASASLTLSTDATAPGPSGRLLGRWLACLLAGLCVAGATGFASLTAGPGTARPGEILYLLSTSIIPISIASTWVLFLGARGGGAAAAVATLLLWVGGHLPWAAENWLGSPFGRALDAWLPGPVEEPVAESALYTSCGVLGLLCLTLARARTEQA
jgi:hypothetical protein